MVKQYSKLLFVSNNFVKLYIYNYLFILFQTIIRKIYKKLNESQLSIEKLHKKHDSLEEVVNKIKDEIGVLNKKDESIEIDNIIIIC